MDLGDAEKRLKREWSRAWQTFVAKVEVLALVGLSVILTTFLYDVLLWFGVSERTTVGLTVVFGGTLYWMLVMYWMWAFVEGENRRRNKKP